MAIITHYIIQIIKRRWFNSILNKERAFDFDYFGHRRAHFREMEPTGSPTNISMLFNYYLTLIMAHVTNSICLTM